MTLADVSLLQLKNGKNAIIFITQSIDKLKSYFSKIAEKVIVIHCRNAQI